MRSFWWFEQPFIAGMARPGLNELRWDEFDFEEAVLVGFLGTKMRGRVSLATLSEHALNYAPKISRFYQGKGAERADAFFRAAVALSDPTELSRTLERLRRIHFLGSTQVTDEVLEFDLDRQCLQRDVEALRFKGIRRLVCLTEHANDFEFLGMSFEMHHIPIADVGVPTLDQAESFANIIRDSQKTPTAVYCMAGLGRTSIMLMASCLLRGDAWKDVWQKIRLANPDFILAGAQKEFIGKLLPSRVGNEASVSSKASNSLIKLKP
jgi:hypothetical protein